MSGGNILIKNATDQKINITIQPQGEAIVELPSAPKLPEFKSQIMIDEYRNNEVCVNCGEKDKDCLRVLRDVTSNMLLICLCRACVTDIWDIEPYDEYD